MTTWDKIQTPKPSAHINIKEVTGNTIVFTTSPVGSSFAVNHLRDYGVLYDDSKGNQMLKVAEGVYNVNEVANYMRSVNEHLMQEYQ